MVTGKSEELCVPASVERQAAEAVADYLDARDHGRAAVPTAFAPRDPKAAAEFWRAVEGLAPLVGDL